MADDQTNQLILLTQASQLLADARTIEDITQVRSVAESARAFAKAAQMGLELQNQAAEVKLRAERKAGQFLANLNLRGGDRKSNGRNDRLKLDDLGISENQSKRWQRLASVSEDEFDQFVETTTLFRKEITAAGLLRQARNGRAKKTPARTIRIDQPASSLNNNQHTELLELIQELRNHHELLSNVLRPLCNGGEHKLKVAEYRVLGHLLEEMTSTIQALEKTTRFIWSS